MAKKAFAGGGEEEELLDRLWFYECPFSPRKKKDTAAKQVKDKTPGDGVNADAVARVFGVLDLNGDGRVSSEEMMKFLERVGVQVPVEEVEVAMQSASKSADMSLSVMDLTDLFSIVLPPTKTHEDEDHEDHDIRKAFSVFDEDGDGYISAAELARVLHRLGFLKNLDIPLCEEMIQRVDSNGDGVIDVHEFRLMMMKDHTAW